MNFYDCVVFWKERLGKKEERTSSLKGFHQESSEQNSTSVVIGIARKRREKHSSRRTKNRHLGSSCVLNLEVDKQRTERFQVSSGSSLIFVLHSFWDTSIDL